MVSTTSAAGTPGSAMAATGMPRPLSTTVHAAVGVQGDHDVVAVALERLVDAVVDHLVHEVVEAAGAGRADVHAGPAANRLKPLENGDVFGVIAGFGQ